MKWLRHLTAADPAIDEALAQLAQDDELRAQLNETLHSRPVNIALSSLSVVAIAWVCALTVREAALIALATALTLLGAVRIGYALAIARTPERVLPDWLDAIRAWCALGFAGALGTLAGLMLLQPETTGAATIAVVMAVAFGTSMPIRNGARPLIATGKLALTLLPVFIACLIVATPPLLALALVLPSMALVSAGHARNTLQNLAERISIAQSSRMYAEAMREQSRTDPVTGLSNRNGFERDLVLLLEDLPETSRVMLLWLDLHRFKEVNEALGHASGDAVLQKTAARLLMCAPPGAAVSRFASDEFLLACRVPSRAAAEQIAQCVGRGTAQPMRLDGHRIEGGASVGAALLPDDASTAERLMQAADLALYHAKTRRDDNIRFFNESMTRALAHRKEIESELRSAIQRDELTVYFQPIVDLKTGRIRTFEALVRWFHAEKGEIAPDEFVPVAEDTGLIITLGNWITAQAAKAASLWPDDVMLAVNLSPVQIKAPGAALGILNALKEARLDPSRLELEVTESLFLEDDEQTTAFMQDLAREGVRFALDDFGTGYSSLRYIHMHPFRTIKVDRSFVSGANAGERSDAIIRAVAEMGSTLDMEIVAEGLETIEQVRGVRKAGCTLGQGWYFSRAVPNFTATVLLAQEREPESAQEHLQHRWQEVG